MEKPLLSILLALTMGTIVVVWLRPDLILPRIAIVRNGQVSYDLNGDGRIDYREYWDQGTLIRIDQDTSYSGQMDLTTYFQDDEPISAEIDIDHDGVVDYRESYETEEKPGMPSPASEGAVQQ